MQGDENKTEQPTPHRLEKARERGELAKSSEFTGWLVMVSFFICVLLTGRDVANAVLEVTRNTFRLAGARPEVAGELGGLLLALLAPVGQALVPAAMAVVVVAALGNLGQAGAVLTAYPLGPRLDRMNPSNAINRIFSIQSVFELAKLSLKMLLLGALAWWAWRGLDAWVAGLAVTPPDRPVGAMLDGFRSTSLWVLLALGLMAVVDLLFVRWQHLRKMRMSRREVKDEHKQRDGDPEIRAKRKRMLRDLLKRSRSAGNAGNADVILTNPTHVAVGLRYRPKDMRAPVVVTKGAGHFAARIRREAALAGVPSLRRPELARRLFRECAVDQPISPAVFRDLAPIYRWLMSRPGQRILP